MKNIKIEQFKKELSATHNYGWSNESYLGYETMFEKIKELHGNEMQIITSVGGGEHILFALNTFKNVKCINHVDISAFAFVFAFLKFTIIKEYDFEKWIKFLNGTISLLEVTSILKKSSFFPLIQELFENSNVENRMTNCLTQSFSSTSYLHNLKFFTSKSIFKKLQQALIDIEDYKMFFGNIYATPFNFNKDSSLILASNAYGMPKDYIFNFNSKFLISTDSKKPSSIIDITIESWNFQLYQNKNL